MYVISKLIVLLIVPPYLSYLCLCIFTIFSCHLLSRRAFSTSRPVTPGCDVRSFAPCRCVRMLDSPSTPTDNLPELHLPSFPILTLALSPSFSLSLSPSPEGVASPPCSPKSTRDSASRPGSLRVEQLLPPLDSTRRSTTSAGPDADGTQTPSGEYAETIVSNPQPLYANGVKVIIETSKRYVSSEAPRGCMSSVRNRSIGIEQTHLSRTEF